MVLTLPLRLCGQTNRLLCLRHFCPVHRCGPTSHCRGRECGTSLSPLKRLPALQPTSRAPEFSRWAAGDPSPAAITMHKPESAESTEVAPLPVLKGIERPEHWKRGRLSLWMSIVGLACFVLMFMVARVVRDRLEQYFVPVLGLFLLYLLAGAAALITGLKARHTAEGKVGVAVSSTLLGLWVLLWALKHMIGPV